MIVFLLIFLNHLNDSLSVPHFLQATLFVALVGIPPFTSNIYFGNGENIIFRNYLTGDIDDMIVTDNGDSEKVLATVVAAIYAFCDKFPEAWIYATGSTTARTRLYRIGINKYYDVVENDFEIFGQTQNEWERYQKGKDYEAFVIQRKKS